jgi:catechol 2,3-dioxygenase-like lactoylglutathione lyase family enzyme
VERLNGLQKKWLTTGSRQNGLSWSACLVQRVDFWKIEKMTRVGPLQNQGGDLMAPHRTVEHIFPVLGVVNLTQSVHFYTETLGFHTDWLGDGVGSVSRDGNTLMLSEEAIRGGCVWIGLVDDSLFDVYVSRGVTVRREPRNYSWAYEMKIEDPNGNILWLGTEPKENLHLLDKIVT